MMVRFAFVLLLAACQLGDRPGTLVGNPGKMAVRLAQLDAETNTLEAEAGNATALWLGCDSGFASVAQGVPFDLLDGPALDIPGGRGSTTLKAG